MCAWLVLWYVLSNCQQTLIRCDLNYVWCASQVGVDINLAANVPWRSHSLQFVPGLGPRKAQALLQVRGESRLYASGGRKYQWQIGFCACKLVDSRMNLIAESVC